MEYIENPRVYPDTNGELSVARASRLVIVSAGAFGSPCILERSGIGAKYVLEKHGVEELVDLPGVGENYQGAQSPSFRRSIITNRTMLQTIRSFSRHISQAGIPIPLMLSFAMKSPLSLVSPYVAARSNTD